MVVRYVLQDPIDAWTRGFCDVIEHMDLIRLRDYEEIGSFCDAS